MKNKYISWIVDGIMSGLFLTVGCTVFLLSESKLAGAFLFSLGLYAIITFKLGLYTGKAGYIVLKPPRYIAEVAMTFLGNIAGTCIAANLIRLTRFGTALSENAAEVIGGKLADGPISIFILAVFCGMLMFTAVEGSRRCTESGNHIGGLFIVVMPVMVFIICGFNHSVADSAYFFLSGCAGAERAAAYFAIAVTGNAAGCMLIPTLKKLSINK